MNLQPTFQQNPPLSLYIHLPWCIKKCPYCDFNSHPAAAEHASQQGFDEVKYIEALLVDLEQDLPLIWGRTIESIFIGGGTPSLFSGRGINQLISAIRSLLPLKPNTEITMEANPGTAEADKFKAYFDAGINRLSLGVQSFQDPFLHVLGRIHTVEQAYQAFEMAKLAGFEQINIDLMFGLPAQSTAQALFDLSTAIRLQPEHISWYQLTIEPNTHFHAKPPILPAEEEMSSINQEGLALLQHNGYQRYEVSAFAKKENFCQHNLNYWQFGDYLGIGAGAHSKITHVPSGKILRRQKTRQPKTYLNKLKPFIAQENAINVDELPLEFMLNALRLTEGVSSQLFQAHSGLSPMLIEPTIKKAQQQQLMKNWPLRIQPTELGLRFLNDTLALFFPENLENFPQLTSIPITTID